MVVYYGEKNFYDSICDVTIVKLQDDKVFRIINNDFLFETQSLVTTYSSEYLTVPVIVNFYTCSFLYDHFRVVKSSNFILSLLSEQYMYTTRNASSDQLYIPFSHSKKY